MKNKGEDVVNDAENKIYAYKEKKEDEGRKKHAVKHRYYVIKHLGIKIFQKALDALLKRLTHRLKAAYNLTDVRAV